MTIMCLERFASFAITTTRPRGFTILTPTVARLGGHHGFGRTDLLNSDIHAFGILEPSYVPGIGCRAAKGHRPSATRESLS